MSTPRDDGYVRIFDTTLRDGEQSPGASLTSEEKLLLAHQIAALGVDVLEAGFPAASPDDRAAVARIAREVGSQSDAPIIAGLARACRGDIERAGEAVTPARRGRIHTFLATSDLHLEHKLGISRAEAIDRTAAMVAYARQHADDVEFSPEDAGRSDPEFLCQVLAAAIEAGATTLNIPDTVGYTLPDEYGDLIARLMRRTVGARQVIWSVHCHDDLGLATANSLAGVRAGARQIEVTVNGIGERAGNASLEEVVMAIATRLGPHGLRTGIDHKRLCHTSRAVADFTGMPVPPNKAVVGCNAFAHEAGIHQDGMLKDQRTYEIMRPETVGAARTRLVLGKHSGRHAFRVRIEALGIKLDEHHVADAFTRFKALAERKKVITDADLMALVHENVSAPPEQWRLVGLRVACARSALSTANVRLRGPGGEREGAGAGHGSIEAVFEAIGKITGITTSLNDFRLESVTGGADALGAVSVQVSTPEAPTRTFHGYGIDTDIVVAGALAYLAAINRILDSLPAATPENRRQAIPASPAKTTHAPFEGPCPIEANDEPFPADYTAGIP